MVRGLHRWSGQIFSVLVVALCLSGAALSVFPVLEAIEVPGPSENGLSVATLAERVLANYSGVEQIRRDPSGRITAYWFDGDTPGSGIIDPATGLRTGSVETSVTERWLKNFHRSLFLDESGRVLAAMTAIAVLLLALTGMALVVQRMGGWRRLFVPLKGPLKGAFIGRVHVEIARLSIIGLTVSSVTALLMSLSTFELVNSGDGSPPFPIVSGKDGIAPGRMQPLRDIEISELRELTFPIPGILSDVYTLRTVSGEGYLDQGTGALLGWRDLSAWDSFSDLVKMIHTGQGLAFIGGILGAMALGTVVLAITGVGLWLLGRRGRARMRDNVALGDADTIVLVGSEAGSTWEFAATLVSALTAGGSKVHAAPMSSFAPGRYVRASHLIVMTSTYNDGAAPGSAKGFLDRLSALTDPPKMPLAVLGFGDRGFREYCFYAQKIVRVAESRGWSELSPMHTVDRQLPQDFMNWGRVLGTAMGIPLELNHHPVAPRADSLELISRRDYGSELTTPAAILRFKLSDGNVWRRFPRSGVYRFVAGDLLAIIPEGSALPRYYSLASCSADRFAEICVRKYPDGVCSGQLLDLKPGQTIQAFVRRNPAFRPVRGNFPVILIGAGTGIGPLAGFARANTSRRPMHLWFGTRRSDSDLYFAEEIAEWQADGRLTSVTTAFSRSESRLYVQDALRNDRALIVRLISEGAQLLICGGRGMAEGVEDVISDLLASSGLTTSSLKAEGRYVEDVY